MGDNLKGADMKKIIIATKLDFQKLVSNLYVCFGNLKDSFIGFIGDLIVAILHTIMFIPAIIARPIVNSLIVNKNRVVKLDNDNLEALHKVTAMQFKNDTFMQNAKYNEKFDIIVNAIIKEYINKDKNK